MKLAIRPLQKMRFFQKDKDKKKQQQVQHQRQLSDNIADHQLSKYSTQVQQNFRNHNSPLYLPTRASTLLFQNLPKEILPRIFSFVCPHTQDETYETCETSAIFDACMLCDLRDLANCARVCWKWNQVANAALYHSIRIDAVHYCPREIYLSEQRKRKTFFKRNADPEDTPAVRLKLLCRTLREDPTRFGSRVRYFKVPYMLREAATADLARIIHVLPNLLYVDLPEGLFADEHGYATLRLEVEARCRDLRKMTYHGGSEGSLSKMANGGIWPNLEVLELHKINMDPYILRHALASLTQLRALKVMDSQAFSDDILSRNEDLPPFPPVEELILSNTPNVTANGLTEYLGRADTRNILTVLSLLRTGVHPATLAEILLAAQSLQTLVIEATVSDAFKSGPRTRRLASTSLESLRFEITAAKSAGPYSSVTASYYTYLAASLRGNGMPNLRSVYVLDEHFQDELEGLPRPQAPFSFGNNARPKSAHSVTSHRPMSGFNGGGRGGLAPPNSGGMAIPRPFAAASNVRASQRFSSTNPFAGTGPLSHPLTIYTKSDDDLDWSSVMLQPTAPAGGGHHRGGSMSLHGDRPISSYGLGADIAGLGWNTAAARKSVMVGNGAGMFMAIPSQSTGGSKGSDEDYWPRPSTANNEKKSADLWR
ncbi:F-box domain-containing protein [Colletotrichum karsti]|uniref:F-box domain-containing protein n=1 Tax=Colletotrichum karsti TaxID=1095194 RepID=A0A9P6IHM3_9PEZI|nr:F-box domain-containing protein [Colletotrichum karsti]KAF9881031.1 F-box domain-containing protein [Colletotrichum karsti]